MRLRTGAARSPVWHLVPPGMLLGFVVSVSVVHAQASHSALTTTSPNRSSASAPPVTVADLIGMTLFGSDPYDGEPGSEADIHELSPDGAHVAVVIQRGNLARNTVDYALLVFAMADIQHVPHPGPDTVTRFASATNEPGISHVEWLADNRTIAFLGERGDEKTQVYTVDITTHMLTSRTHSATGITSFEIALAGEAVIYQEQPTIDTSRYATMRAHGFVLSPKALVFDVIAGNWLDGAKWEVLTPKGYRIARAGTDAPLLGLDSIAGYKECGLHDSYHLRGSVSPRGDAVLFTCMPRTPPATWNGYRNERYRLFVDKFDTHGRELVLLDLTTGRARLVSGTPLLPSGETPFVWAPDGHAVLVSGALLPLAGPDSARRVTQRMAAEIDVNTEAIAVVAPRDSLVVQEWDARTGLVDFAQASDPYEVTAVTPHVYYRKTTHGWTKVAAPTAVTAPGPTLIIDQDPNTPPRLAVADPNTRAKHVIFDPNPGLRAAHRFGRVEVFHWTTKAGNAFAGGLYYPPDYVPGRRYPLVIQTHGYDSTTFAPQGPFTTGEAAQPLANAGILVLQTAVQVAGERGSKVSESPGEAPWGRDLYEGAIEALDQRGLIDRTKVGMQGFSRTCFDALYFLTHSPYPIEAADLTDGVDYGYLQYLVLFPKFGSSWERVNGGRPWGATQAQWMERASGFHLDRVTTPLRLTALGSPGSLLYEWEPYAGLLRQNKPAELVYIPDGSHVLVKPWERLTSQQGAVDWYRFWLQGYEDSEAAKAEQYARWHMLRAQRDSTVASAKP